MPRECHTHATAALPFAHASRSGTALQSPISTKPPASRTAPHALTSPLESVCAPCAYDIPGSSFCASSAFAPHVPLALASASSQRMASPAVACIHYGTGRHGEPTLTLCGGATPGCTTCTQASEATATRSLRASSRRASRATSPSFATARRGCEAATRVLSTCTSSPTGCARQLSADRGRTMRSATCSPRNLQSILWRSTRCDTLLCSTSCCPEIPSKAIHTSHPATPSPPLAPSRPLPPPSRPPLAPSRPLSPPLAPSRPPLAPLSPLSSLQLGALALNAAERELGRDADGSHDDQSASEWLAGYDLGKQGPAHVLQDSLTSGLCECTCDGVHYPHVMPAVIVGLADKLERVAAAAGVAAGKTRSRTGTVGGHRSHLMSNTSLLRRSGGVPSLHLPGTSGDAMAGARTYGFAARAASPIARTVQWQAVSDAAPSQPNAVCE